ncbi:MAG: hypothetical protein DI619_01200 [Francisella sp.]|nr:MAG: hypothetical protein DI619_01200 [Francisella sp.]
MFKIVSFFNYFPTSFTIRIPKLLLVNQNLSNQTYKQLKAKAVVKQHSALQRSKIESIATPQAAHQSTTL